MFEISQLKEKKLSELQDIAKELSVPKYRSLKKLDLVYQILDHQASNPQTVIAVKDANQPKEVKPRKRVQKPRPNQPKAKVQANIPNPTEKTEEPQKEKQAQPKAENKPNKVERHIPNKVERHASKQGDKPHKNNPNAKRDNPNQQRKDNNPPKGNNHNQGNNGNKDTRNRYREPDFEFDAIIESEGVLDIMQDGYGFLRSSD